MTSIDLQRRTVNGHFQATTIINTIPWTIWSSMAAVPAEIAVRIAELLHVGIDVDYHPESLSTSTHWTYEPREELPHHRSLVRHNFLPGSRGYWTETNTRRSVSAEGFRHRSDYSYPVNTRSKPATITAVLAWARSHGIIGAGRWGLWEHMNSDVAVAEAMRLASTLVAKQGAGPA